MVTTTTISAMQPRAAVASAICILALLAACNGDDSTDPAPTAGAPATSDATPPTDAPTTSTTSTTTTSTPTPTTIDTETLIAEIEADLNAGEQALLKAIGAPGDPASVTLIEQHFSGESLGTVSGALETLSVEGLVGRPNPEVDSVLVVRSVDDVDESQTRAEVTVCRVDAAVIVEVFADGSEAIVNDRVTTVVSRSIVLKPGPTWVLDSGSRLEDLPGATTCE
jgi:hypothetical protein